MRIRTILTVICIILIVIVALVFPIPTHPPDDTRMILDHTLGVYIAPSCFEQSGATNNISETDWLGAQQAGYTAESECTEEALLPIHQSVVSKIWIGLGLQRDHWDW